MSYDPNGAFEHVGVGETGTDVFTYTLDDGTNGRAVGTVIVTITGANDTPSLTGTSAVVVDEGSLALHTGSYTEPDANDTLTFVASIGTVTDNGNGTWNWSQETTDDTSASETVTITVKDQHNVGSSFQFQKTVNNVAPTITMTGANSVPEGSAYALELGSVIDPGDDTVTSLTIDWGDGSTEPANASDTTTHVYADGEATRTISMSVVDEDGTHVAATKTITVNNVAPTISANSASLTAIEGDVITTAGTYAELGDDTVTLKRVDWQHCR